jgi:hypothetical protein
VDWRMLVGADKPRESRGFHHERVASGIRTQDSASSWRIEKRREFEIFDVSTRVNLRQCHSVCIPGPEKQSVPGVCDAFISRMISIPLLPIPYSPSDLKALSIVPRPAACCPMGIAPGPRFLNSKCQRHSDLRTLALVFEPRLTSALSQKTKCGSQKAAAHSHPVFRLGDRLLNPVNRGEARVDASKDPGFPSLLRLVSRWASSARSHRIWRRRFERKQLELKGKVK